MTGSDESGNSVEVDPVDVTLTSNVATDVVDGLTVMFPTASPHVITARVGSVEAAVKIEVHAAESILPTKPTPPAHSARAPALATTGGVTIASIGAAATLLLLLGTALIARRRVRASAQ